jgi:serine/threonine protein kinase
VHNIAAVQPGARIGDYIVRGELRREDIGIVYEAVHLVLPRQAAIKVCDAFTKSIAVQMLREACILEALAHPAAPRVFECGVLPDRRPWVATELVDGSTLAHEINDGPLEIADLLAIVRTIADVLAHAHARNVVHHHVTERVVVRTPGRTVPVCLIGWSEVATRDGDRGGEPADDIHALGALAYRALTGSAVVGALPDYFPPVLSQLITDMLGDDSLLRPTAVEVRDRVDEIAAIGKPKFLPRERLTTINDDSQVRVRIRR